LQQNFKKIFSFFFYFFIIKKEIFLKQRRFSSSKMDTVTIPREEFESMKQELDLLRNSKIYKRLLEFEHNISKGERFTRKDLGF